MTVIGDIKLFMLMKIVLGLSLLFALFFLTLQTVVIISSKCILLYVQIYSKMTSSHFRTRLPLHQEVMLSKLHLCKTQTSWRRNTQYDKWCGYIQFYCSLSSSIQATASCCLWMALCRAASSSSVQLQALGSRE